MYSANSKITKKLIKSSPELYQSNHPSDDYEFNLNQLWISDSDFIKIQTSFHFFSTQPLISGILFCKSKKKKYSQWYKAKFYSLYRDRLVLYSKKNLTKQKRVMILKGVHFRLLDSILNANELQNLITEGIIEKKCIVLSRKNKFELFFAGNEEMHNAWVKQFRKCCILHNFKKFYKITKLLGSGNTADIYEAISNENHEIVAVKILEKSKMMKSCFKQSKNEKEKETKIYLSIENEINVLKNLDHENIIHFKEIYEGKNSINLIFEELKGGDLFEKLNKRNFEVLPDQDIHSIMKQLLKAVKYLHDKEIMHRDIKLENIFFVNTEDLSLKLGDFGLAEHEIKKEFLFNRCGTPGCLAPEVLLGNKYNKKCDIFSVGLAFYILLTGKHLLYGENCDETYYRNLKAEKILNKLNFNKINASTKCIDLLKQLLKISPNERISADEALEHDYFKSYNKHQNKNNRLMHRILTYGMNNSEFYNSPKGKSLFLESEFLQLHKVLSKKPSNNKNDRHPEKNNLSSFKEIFEQSPTTTTHTFINDAKRDKFNLYNIKSIFQHKKIEKNKRTRSNNFSKYDELCENFSVDDKLFIDSKEHKRAKSYSLGIKIMKLETIKSSCDVLYIKNQDDISTGLSLRKNRERINSKKINF